MTDLQIETEEAEGRACLTLRGEFDLAGIQHFEGILGKAEAARPKAIVIDLSGLQFMDSSGLRALVTADDRARKAGRRLAIVPGPPPVRRVFEITQLVGRLDLVEDPSSVGP